MTITCQNVTILDTGSVAISSTPSGAAIYIDTVLQTGTTPQTYSGLTAGSHTYKLTLSGYTDATGSFSITAGSTTTLPVTLATVANITATNVTITKSANPCITGSCTVTITVRWSNSGGTDGTVIPNIKIDTVLQTPHTSRVVTAGGYIDEAFIVSNLTAATHVICPDPN